MRIDAALRRALVANAHALIGPCVFSLAVLALLAPCCTSMEDLEQLDNECSPGTFDVSTRNELCSGSYLVATVYSDSTLTAPRSRTMIDISGDYAALADVIHDQGDGGTAEVQLRLLERDSLDPSRWREIRRGRIAFDGSADHQVSGIGLLSGEAAEVAVVRQYGTVEVVTIQASDWQHGQMLDALPATSQLVIDDIFARNLALLKRSCPQDIQGDGRVGLPLTDIEVIHSASEPYDERFLLLSGPCGLIRLDIDEGVDGSNFVQYNLPSYDAEIDQHRIYLAAGSDGLIVRDLGSVTYDPLGMTVMCQEDTDCPDGLPCTLSWCTYETPSDQFGYRQDSDQVESAHITRISVGDGHIFGLSEPFHLEDASLSGFVVAWTLDESGDIVAGRTGTFPDALSSEFRPHVTDEIWEIVQLDEGLVAVLQTVSLEDEGRSVPISKVRLLDTPPNRSPVEIWTGSLGPEFTSPILAIGSYGDALWTVDNNGIASYVFTIEGDYLRR